jgi:hypothetical protein
LVFVVGFGAEQVQFVLDLQQTRVRILVPTLVYRICFRMGCYQHHRDITQNQPDRAMKHHKQ